MTIDCVNLSLATTCRGRCIFCPTDVRGRRIGAKLMPYALAKRILDELAGPEFAALRVLRLGENGDALMNAAFLAILLHARRTLPSTVEIELFTNLEGLTPELSDVLIDEHLIDKLSFNIDGCTKERYEAMKGLSWGKALTHAKHFLERRNEANSPIVATVFTIPAAVYWLEVTSKLGVMPLRRVAIPFMDPTEEFNAVHATLHPWLRLSTDFVYFEHVSGWAERAQFTDRRLDYGDLQCPALSRVEHEAFIAPDGTWYACCWDADNEIVMGNVARTSVRDVWASEERRTIIEMLRVGRFAELGGPCRTVNCCAMRPV